MKGEIKTILSKGLGVGYMGKGKLGEENRVDFDLKSNDYQGSEGRYHDAWIGEKNGGGQELVETPDREKATRVYGGGTLINEKLTELGLTHADVIGKLLFFVGKLGDKTRLDANVETNEEDWNYTYEVLESVKEIPVVLGKEMIEYKGTIVFVHFHINSPIK